MAGQPRNIRIDDDIYSALIQCVAARNARFEAEGSKERITIIDLINESLRLQMPIHIWDKLNNRVTKLEQQVSNIEARLDSDRDYECEQKYR
jgi:hypothetical protein